MLNRHYITATRKDGPDYDRRIDAVKLDGQWLSLDTAWHFVNANKGRVFSRGGLFDAMVYAFAPIGRLRYLTTSPDGYGPNNLLHLPDY